MLAWTDRHSDISDTRSSNEAFLVAPYATHRTTDDDRTEATPAT